jgi:hypothetical protein
VSVTVADPPPQPPPPVAGPSSGTFAGLDVGTGASGSTAGGGANAWVVQGAGAGLNGTADAFHYAHQARTGDFDLRAKVASLTGGAAGLIVRNGTLGPSSGVSIQLVDGTIRFGVREGYGSAMTVSQRGTGAAGNLWLRLQRVANTITGYTSTDGTTWASAGTASVGSIPATADLGFLVAGGASGLATARFEGVTG